MERAQPRPADLPDGPIVGFFGLISEWVDQDLLVRVAREAPASHVVLLGRADVPTERLQGVPNLHLLGPRRFEALPEYVAHFAVGLIPFVVNDLTRAVNPIKLREMLAAGCPVVSTELPEVAPYAGQGVAIAATADEFVARVRERLAHPAEAAERARISAGVAGETWQAKVADLLGILEREGATARDPS